MHNLNRFLSNPNIIPIWDLTTAEPPASTSTPGASTSQAPAAPYVMRRFYSVHVVSLPCFVDLATHPRPSLQGQHPNNLRVFEHSSPPWVPTPAPVQVCSFICLTALFSSPRHLISDDEVSLTDILTPSNLLPLFTSHPAILSSLFPHLPPDLLPSGNTPLTPHQTTQLTENLQRTISSPPFRTAVAQLDRALRTGALGGFVRSLGLPESAGAGVGAFLRAIGEQARREGQGGSGQEDRMEED